MAWGKRQFKKRRSPISIKRASLRVFGKIKYFTSKKKANDTKKALGLRTKVKSIKPRRIKNI